MSTKKKVAAIVITTIALTSGTVGISSAASKSSITRVSVTKASVAGVKDPRAKVASVLAALVAKGTITQAQSDSITAALEAAATAARANHPKGPGLGERERGHRPKGGMGGAIPTPMLTPPASPTL